MVGAGVAVALFAAALILGAYRREMADLNQDIAWHVMFHEEIWGEWRSGHE